MGMMRPLPRSPHLAALLAREADVLSEAWARALRELPDSHYRLRPEGEIRDWTRRGLAAIIRSLERGDPASLEPHLRRLVETRGRLGFDIEEVLLGLARLTRCALPVVIAELGSDPAQLTRALADLDACVDATVARFGAMFAGAMRDRVEIERRSTARLLEAVEEVAGPATLSSTLGLAAKHIRSSLGASACAVYLRQRNKQRLALGATSGEPLPRSVDLLLQRTLDLRADATLRAALRGHRPGACRGSERCPFLGGRTCESLNLSAVVVVPVLSHRRLVALAVAIYEVDRSEPDEDRLRLAHAMASTLGSVIDNARLYAEARQRLAESATMQQVSSALLEESTLADMLELICRESRRLVRASCAAVLLRDAAGEWNVAARAGQLGADRLRWLAEAWDRDGDAWTVEAVVFDDRPQERRPTPRREEPSVGIPLRVANEIVGVLHAGKERGRFDDDDLRLLERMAAQATIAVEHARWHRHHEEALIVEERHRLSRDLHDSVTQSLYSVTMFAEATARLMERGHSSEASEHLRDLRDIAQQALWEMRLLIFELHPPDLDALGLESVLQARLGTVERRAGLATRFRCEALGRLPARLEHGLYRIAQEALNNAIRHARATRVSLDLTASDSSVRMVFTDDGIGFDLEEGRRKGGLGLRSMDERARSMGGSLAIETRADQGTRIEVEIPLPEVEDSRRLAGAVGVVAE